MPITDDYINKCLENIDKFIYLTKYVKGFKNVSPKHTAALRRISMELTRSLTELRKSEDKIRKEEKRFNPQFTTNDNFKSGDKVLICKYDRYGKEDTYDIEGTFIVENKNNYYPYLVTYKNEYDKIVVDWVYKIIKE